MDRTGASARKVDRPRVARARTFGAVARGGQGWRSKACGPRVKAAPEVILVIGMNEEVIADVCPCLPKLSSRHCSRGGFVVKRSQGKRSPAADPIHPQTIVQEKFLRRGGKLAKADP